MPDRAATRLWNMVECLGSPPRDGHRRTEICHRYATNHSIYGHRGGWLFGKTTRPEGDPLQPWMKVVRRRLRHVWVTVRRLLQWNPVERATIGEQLPMLLDRILRLGFNGELPWRRLCGSAAHLGAATAGPLPEYMRTVELESVHAPAIADSTVETLFFPRHGNPGDPVPQNGTPEASLRQEEEREESDAQSQQVGKRTVMASISSLFELEDEQEYHPRCRECHQPAKYATVPETFCSYQCFRHQYPLEAPNSQV